MDDLDETVACDSDLLDWFNAPTWSDLSVALSIATGAEVEFPEREDLPSDDTRGELSTLVHGIEIEREYPMTIRDLLIDLFMVFENTDCRKAWRQLSDEVARVEGVPVTIGRTPFAPWDEWDDPIGRTYPYVRAAPGSWTVARWRQHRLVPCQPTYARISIAFPDGTTVHGRTHMATLRAAWAVHSRVNRWDSAEPQRLHKVAREARLIGILCS